MTWSACFVEPGWSRQAAAGRRNIMIDFMRNVCFCLDVELGANRARAFAIVAGLAMATTGEMANAGATLDREPYGTTQHGQSVDIFTMTNDHGLRVRFLSYCGGITEDGVPDRAGRGV